MPVSTNLNLASWTAIGQEFVHLDLMTLTLTLVGPKAMVEDSLNGVLQLILFCSRIQNTPNLRQLHGSGRYKPRATSCSQLSGQQLGQQLSNGRGSGGQLGAANWRVNPDQCGQVGLPGRGRRVECWSRRSSPD
ncbi:hypothetical protein RRG08_015420 [Elysia crispata]|uniref:Uncharacterized protein n=1 Tax=Elysia crispata TaxID=231223 RepID=A0AAE0YHJ6_9GAST|nr:hypothetical protein RRG08_015420 [Elysia crispata]